MHLQTMSDA
jgi:hypothetical protein